MTAPREYVDKAESALTDLEGILHALDIVRFEDALNKPGPEYYAIAVLIPMAIAKTAALRQAMEDAAKAKATVKREAFL
jgi:hypothetical protein